MSSSRSRCRTHQMYPRCRHKLPAPSEKHPKHLMHYSTYLCVCVICRVVGLVLALASGLALLGLQGACWADDTLARTAFASLVIHLEEEATPSKANFWSATASNSQQHTEGTLEAGCRGSYTCRQHCAAAGTETRPVAVATRNVDCKGTSAAQHRPSW